MRNAHDQHAEPACSAKRGDNDETAFKAFVVASFLSLTLLTLYVALVAR